jgi:predicted nucleotidyltransferase
MKSAAQRSMPIWQVSQRWKTETDTGRDRPCRSFLIRELRFSRSESLFSELTAWDFWHIIASDETEEMLGIQFVLALRTTRCSSERKITMAVRQKEEVLTIIRNHQQEIRGFGVRRCGFFGSFMREQNTEQSDIDILVEFEPGQKTFDNSMQLAFFLEDLLGREVDLVTVESLSPYIGPHILKEVEYASVSA